MAFEYISSLLKDTIENTNPVEVRGKVEQVVGTIIRAVVPGVKIGELCILRNPWENWELKAEVVGFIKQVVDRNTYIASIIDLLKQLNLKRFYG